MCPSRSRWRRGPGDQMTYQTTLSDAQYARLEPLLPPPSNHLKIPHRQALDAWQLISVRLIRWAKTGVLEGVVQALQQGLLVDSDIDTLSLVSTIIHVHMHGTSARRNGGAKRSAALGVA